MFDIRLALAAPFHFLMYKYKQMLKVGCVQMHIGWKTGAGWLLKAANELRENRWRLIQWREGAHGDVRGALEI